MLNEDFTHLATLIRSVHVSDEGMLRALLSNNVNTIIEALDIAGRSEIKPRGPLNRDGE